MTSNLLILAGVALAALTSIGAIVFAKRFAKDEWDTGEKE
jgi:hypothetical protein